MNAQTLNDEKLKQLLLSKTATERLRILLVAIEVSRYNKWIRQRKELAWNIKRKEIQRAKSKKAKAISESVKDGPIADCDTA